MIRVNVIGAGLAGCEATYQLIQNGIAVDLYEMRPNKSTGAHRTGLFGELVCSNSLRSNSLSNGVGLLKQEMRILGSLIMEMADKNQIPSGSALAVDRTNFASDITNYIKSSPLVNVINKEITKIPEGPTIIATGPLTSSSLADCLIKYLKQDTLHFYDAAAPIITKESINMDIAYYKSRYDKGDADYINCPMNKEQFDKFYNELINGEVALLHEVDKHTYFEGCMPIEAMAKRGPQTLTFGPLKPVGLQVEGKEKAYAVVQLRQDNAVDTLYNLVGFQTNLKWGEQKRIFSLIPGLENLDIVRFGVMHRNTYIKSPVVLNPTYQSKQNPDLFFAGQLTGVEGYIESSASGLLAGHNMAMYLLNKPLTVFPDTTMIGAMAKYITTSSENFQPMNANFGIMRLEKEVKKNERKQAYSLQSLPIVESIKETWK